MNRSEIEEIKGRIPPNRFYEKTTGRIGKPSGGGWRQGGLCPFHEDHKVGNFYFHEKSGGFKCFACGAAGGDIIAFLMKRDRLTFKQAIQKLGAK